MGFTVALGSQLLRIAEGGKTCYFLTVCLDARGEGERVLALESREGTRASRRVEEGLSRSFSGGGGKASCPSPSAGDLRELPRVPLRGDGSCGGRGAPRDSAGSGATEEGLTSKGGRNLSDYWKNHSFN